LFKLYDLEKEEFQYVFEYDVCSPSMIKIDDRCEFPLLLDLDKDNGEYLFPDRDGLLAQFQMIHNLNSGSSLVD
jgi:hypothetical protein